ncbi:hypothetical protein JHK85_030255 [Glycine max]|nr:hypothetical protein JHK85_030255 [Glycine max]
MAFAVTPKIIPARFERGNYGGGDRLRLKQVKCGIDGVMGSIGDPVSAAEEIAFCKTCARFGLGLYLYHEDEMTSF